MGLRMCVRIWSGLSLELGKYTYYFQIGMTAGKKTPPPLGSNHIAGPTCQIHQKSRRRLIAVVQKLISIKSEH
jgi:hypothetical protein